MHVVFEDVKEKSNDPRHRKKFQGINFQEFLYADDTLILAKNFRIANEFLHFSQNLKGEDEPFLHQLPSPCLHSNAKRVFQKASLSECPRQNAIALGGRERPRRHLGAAPGCRCQRRCRGQRRPWPRSWKSRPGFYTMRIHSPAWNLKVKLQEGTLQLLQHITTSISTAFRQICWIFSTQVHSPGECSPTSKGMTPFQLADRKGHAMTMGWLKPVPWHCSWKGVQSFSSFIWEDFMELLIRLRPRAGGSVRVS